ncbi:MAG: hypothetical protein PWQ70_2213 [Clostridiales bacterium]|nr:hypothetical protein [Clostridiales bacterium]
MASILPTNRLSFYALSSMFVLAMVIEFGATSAAITYLSTTLLALFIIPDKLMIIPYFLFFGYYGIVKYFIEKLNNIVLEWVIKILVFNASMYVVYLIAINILFENIDTRFPIWITVLLGQIAFIVYDYGYSIATGYYKNRLRKLLKLK